jgi:hypothetical protein
MCPNIKYLQIMIVHVYNANVDYVQSGSYCKQGLYSIGGMLQFNTDAVDSRLL